MGLLSYLNILRDGFVENSENVTLLLFYCILAYALTRSVNISRCTIAAF
jgi:hypothetical protein